jgi:hypothetical protein
MLSDKKKRFAISSIILSIILLSIKFIDNQTLKFIDIAFLGLMTTVSFWWSLKEGIKTRITFLVTLLPLYYSVGIALFWFLLPSTIWVTIAIVILYGISIYLLFLTENVFSVSSLKTIALYRAAKGVGFLFTLIAFFFSLNALISLKIPYYYLGILVFFIIYPLYLQGFWSSTLQDKMDKRLNSIAIVSAMFQAQVSVILFFWPVPVIVGSLFLTIVFYILLGLGQSKLEDRLFSQTIREYLTVGAVVFIVMLFSTSWAGY